MPGARQSTPILLWLGLGAGVGAAVGVAMVVTGAAGARAQVSPAPVPLLPGLVAAETERVVEIVDGDTLILAGGRQVRLAGIQAGVSSISVNYIISSIL